MTDFPKLDRNKPSIGHIQPEYDGAQYQDGEHFFAGNGTYLFSQRGNGKRYTIGAEKSAPVASQTQQPSPSGQQQAPDPSKDDSANAVDFTLWASGEQKYEWFKVKAAAAALYGDDVDTSGKQALIQSLKQLGVLPK